MVVAVTNTRYWLTVRSGSAHALWIGMMWWIGDMSGLLSVLTRDVLLYCCWIIIEKEYPNKFNRPSSARIHRFLSFTHIHVSSRSCCYVLLRTNTLFPSSPLLLIKHCSIFVSYKESALLPPLLLFEISNPIVDHNNPLLHPCSSSIMSSLIIVSFWLLLL